MIECRVELGQRSYDITVGPGAWDAVGAELRRLKASGALIVSNDTVGPLYGRELRRRLSAETPGLPLAYHELPDGERFKDMDHVMEILAVAAASHLDRAGVFIALGGGVVGDMAGLAAALWMRGVRLIQLPTTLLAQVDSSVGGKTGVNLASGKNLVGAFHQPAAVYIDPAALRTLEPRQVSAGLAEVIKYGLLGDAEFLDWLTERMERLVRLEPEPVSEMIARCCRAKADIVRRDERENGLRALLNLGHTFAHAIELRAGYGTWLHGEAVAIGLTLAAQLSARLGHLRPEEVERTRSLLEAAGLPTRISGLTADQCLLDMRSDKKRLGTSNRLVLLRRLGEAAVETVDDEVIRETLRQEGWG